MSKTTHDKQLAELPLTYKTPHAWATRAMRDPLALLNDHAHLEKKAAANALELLNRWPEPAPPEDWVRAMTNIARDEVEHLGLVSHIISKRGGELTRAHQNQYASELRSHVRTGRGPNELVDRLMVSALIEARSCERFALLSQTGSDADLCKLYNGLFASEAGHYRVFLELAQTVLDEETVAARWDDWLAYEAKVIASQPSGSRIHSGVEVEGGAVAT